MVTVKNFNVRTTAGGRTFVTLDLEGGLEIGISQTTGKPYATTKKCSIPTTFDEVTAQGLIGSTLPGVITKVECEPYEFVNPTTSEKMILDYSWVYNPVPVSEHAIALTSMLKAA